MVRGIEKFREAFETYADNYVIIGGTACDAILSGTLMRPRATNDIDMILVVEKMNKEFALAFWKFIKDGEYKNGKRKRGEDKTPVYELYRFEDGKDGYPIKIELLSRHSDLLGEPSGFYLEPIPGGEDVSSLSAIMMDEDYYNITIENSFVDKGLHFASSIALICLKAKAYLNLIEERENGRFVNTKDIKKHRNDVLKLVATTAFNSPTKVTAEIHGCIMSYIQKINELLVSNPQSLEAALERDSNVIRGYLEILADAFSIK